MWNIGSSTYRLCSYYCRPTCLSTHPSKRAECVIREDVNTSMVRFEVVNLFSEDDGPEVFAAEFNDIEGLDHAGAVTGEPGVLEWGC